jgi:hypothetical protein
MNHTRFSPGCYAWEGPAPPLYLESSPPKTDTFGSVQLSTLPSTMSAASTHPSAVLYNFDSRILDAMEYISLHQAEIKYVTQPFAEGSGI